MAVIKPFKAIRAPKDKVQLLVSKSVVTYPKRIINAILDSNPFSYLHVIHPEHRKEKKTKVNSSERFVQVKKKFDQFIEEGIFQQDSKNGIYIYEQVNKGHKYQGIIGLASIDDYLNNVIKKHELTLEKREQVFESYLNVCNFHAEPVLLCYPDNQNINDTIDQIIHKQEPDYFFTTTDRITHKLWKVSDGVAIEVVKNEFVKIPSLYIADGHHRCASSALNYLHLKKEGKLNPNLGYFMALFIPDSKIKIESYNRVIKDIGNEDTHLFFKELCGVFSVTRSKGNLNLNHHQIGLYYQSNWYSIDISDIQNKMNKASEKLSAHILNSFILKPLLGIKDFRNDKRLGYVEGSLGDIKLKQMVDTGKAQIGFSLPPASIADIKNISDAGETMPPKSTWVEPKLRSGLCVFSLGME